MPPPRVRIYGLRLTKRQYLFCVGCALLLLAVLTPLWSYQGRAQLEQMLRDRMPALAPFVSVVPWVVLGALGLEAAEVYFVLKRFARAEQETPTKTL